MRRGASALPSSPARHEARAIGLIATHSPSLQLVCDTDVKTARIVKGRLEKTVLGQIARVISQKLCPGTCFVKARPEQSVSSPASNLEPFLKRLC